MTPPAQPEIAIPNQFPGGSAGPVAGAYGLRVHGIRCEGLTVEAPDGWPLVRVRQRRERPRSPEYTFDGDRAQVPLLGGGRLAIERRSLEAVFSVPHLLSDADLLHPYFAPAAAWMSHWLGRESFHAGAIGIGGYAYGVLGDKEAGKSSLLAWFANSGVEVLTDDMLVLADGAVLTGPRCIDLRDPTVEALELAGSGSSVRGDTRQRVPLPQTAPEWPLGGWLFLSWGPEPAMREIPPKDRVVRLAPHRVLRVLPRRPEALLPLAALPSWDLTRPRRWDVMDRVVDLVSKTVAL